MTLDRARMSLRTVFVAGMAYVALSRCRSLACVQLDDYNTQARIYLDRAHLARAAAACSPSCCMSRRHTGAGAVPLRPARLHHMPC